ncbi:hypothetical protein ES703_00501 [subsurface metagenome]
MKKMAAIFILGILLVSAFACGGGGEEEATPTPTPTPTPTAGDLLIIEASDAPYPDSTDPCVYTMTGYIQNVGSVQVNHVKLSVSTWCDFCEPPQYIGIGAPDAPGATHILDIEPGQVKEFTIVHGCPDWACEFRPGQTVWMCRIYDGTCLPSCESRYPHYINGTNTCQITISKVR